MKNGQTLQVLGLALVLANTGWAQVTQRVSVSSAGVQGNGYSYSPSISADGLSVAFVSNASNLITWDTNSVPDVYYRAWQNNYTEIVSVNSSAALGNGSSYFAAISADGRSVAFASDATNLVPGDTNGKRDIFVRGRSIGTTERMSINSNGVQGNGNSFLPSISADGLSVAFESDAYNFAQDTNNSRDVFLRDGSLGRTERVSDWTNPFDPMGGSYSASISADGRYVAFASDRDDLVPGDTNGRTDVFLLDRSQLYTTTTRISVSSAGVQGNGNSNHPSISADGLSVAFESTASNLITWDTNGVQDIFYRAWQSNYTEIVSVDSSAHLANARSYGASISADGRSVAFDSFATNLVPADSNGKRDIFVRNRSIGTTQRVSISSGGVQGNGDSSDPSISADGRYVAFASTATNLVPGDTNALMDVFLRDRGAIQ